MSRSDVRGADVFLLRNTGINAHDSYIDGGLLAI